MSKKYFKLTATIFLGCLIKAIKAILNLPVCCVYYIICAIFSPIIAFSIIKHTQFYIYIKYVLISFLQLLKKKGE